MEAYDDAGFNPEDEALVDLSASVTIDEATAMHLGWRKSAFFNVHMQESEKHIPNVRLRYLDFSVRTLAEQLAELREEARQRLSDAIESSEPDEVRKWTDAEYEYSVLVERAKLYHGELLDEVAKLATSAVRIDPERSGHSGKIYYTRVSIERWDGQRKGSASLLPADGDDLPVKGALTRTKAKGLYITLGILLKAYAKAQQEIDPKCRFFEPERERVIKENLAKHLAELAPRPGSRRLMQGQSEEAIKTRIELALNALAAPDSYGND